MRLEPQFGLSPTGAGIVTDAEQFDAIVVGCSTTGLALAKSLAVAGARIAAVDRWRLAPRFDRGTHLDDETARAFQTLGVADMEPTRRSVDAGRGRAECGAAVGEAGGPGRSRFPEWS